MELVPSLPASSARSWVYIITGTGSSGTIGGVMRSMEERSIPPSALRVRARQGSNLRPAA
jgi:hypothetical protein